MNNRYLLIGAAVVLVIVALVLLASSRTKSTAPAPAAIATNATTQALSVTYTNDGFSPAELVVKPGTTITFINQSDSPLWVASAPHPTHTLYPEFDAKASVQKGGSYSFTFIKTGEHPYHNHMLLGKYGKVIVQ